MHYTSIENIHKVIDPLFLNDLRRELDDILGGDVSHVATVEESRSNRDVRHVASYKDVRHVASYKDVRHVASYDERRWNQRLAAFQDKLSSLTFLDSYHGRACPLIFHKSLGCARLGFLSCEI